MDKIKVMVVSGPTASGKSDLAIRLARKFNGEVISADSRQVYRGMDIGSGKVTKKEQRMAPHHLLDVASPNRQYTVAHWKKAAQKIIRAIVRRGKLPIICGGTGFWIDALVYDLAIPEVKPNAPLRARLAKLSPTQLFTRLQKLDPIRASTIDRYNPVRLVRALEIVTTTGEPVPAPQRIIPPYHLLYLGITLPKETIASRIERRLDARLKHGMLAEVKRLHASGVSWKKLESFGLEYRWLAQYLQKKITRQEMRAGLLRDIIAYSKRQMTWLRRNNDAQWITSKAQAIRLVKLFVSGEHSPSGWAEILG